MESRAGLLDRQLPWRWILALAGAVFFIPFIGGVPLFDWDEINFAEISREMITTGDYLTIQVNYKEFFEKPPFFPWLQVLCMKIFGINEFAARLPNALGGMLTLVLLYELGKRWISERMGILWALLYLGSVLPTLYHKSGIIDPWFNLFIFAGLMAWMQASLAIRRPAGWYLAAGLLSGMAILTKGPVGPLLIGLVVLIQRIVTRDARYLRLAGIGLFILGNVIIAGTWFGANWLANGPDFIVRFLKYQVELLTQSVAGHKGFPGYHFVVALFGLFPASLFALGALVRRETAENQTVRDFKRLMTILTIVVLVLFSIVQSKIVHYSSMTYYPVAFLAAWMVDRLLDGRERLPSWLKYLSVGVSVLIVLVIALLPYVGMHLSELPQYVRLDAFSAKAITAPVRWGAIDYVPALLLVVLCGAVYWSWRNGRKDGAMLFLSGGMALWVNIALIFFIGKVERYTQHAAIEFCESKAGENVTITPVGFKSYLPFFYAKKPASGAPPEAEFFILREDKRKRMESMPGVDILYERNGYIFLEMRKGED